MFGGSLDPGLLGYGFPEGYFLLLHGALRLYVRWLRWWHAQEINLGCVFAVNPTNLLLVGRILSAVLGTLTLIPTALIARRLVSPRLATRAAFVAALLLAVNYLHGRDSRFAVTDASVTFFIAWTVWALVRFAEDGRATDAFLSGALTGLSISIKWVALFLLPVLALVLLLFIWRHRSGTLGRRLLVAGLSLLLALGGFLALSPHVPGELNETYNGIVGHQMRYDATEVSRFLLDPTADLGRGFVFHSVVTLPIALGRAGLAAALLGLAFAFCRKPRAAWVCLATLLFVFGAAVGPIRLLFVRYCMPVIPIFVALAGAGIVEAVDGLSPWRDRPRVQLALLGLLAIAIAAEPAIRLVRADEILSRTDTRELAARWIISNALAGTTTIPETAYTCIYALEAAGLTACNAVLPSSLRGIAPNLPGHSLNWQEEVARGRQGWGTIADSALNGYWNAPGLAGNPDYLTRGTPILSCGKPAPMRGLEPLAPECWEEAARFTPGHPSCTAVYDLFDQFYLPYAGFDGIERPGPEMVVYRNRCKRGRP